MKKELFEVHLRLGELGNVVCVLFAELMCVGFFSPVERLLAQLLVGVF